MSLPPLKPRAATPELHKSRLIGVKLSDRSTVDFTFYFTDEMRWEGKDHHIALRRA